MTGLFVAAAILAFFTVIHVAAWRLNAISRSVLNLVIMYLLAVVFCGSVWFVLFGPSDWTWLFRAILVSGSVFMVYLSMYMAVEKDSPSAVFLLTVESAGPAGVPLDTLQGLLNDDEMIVSRLEGLVQSGMVRNEGGRYRLAGLGRLFLGAIRAARCTFTDRPIGG